MCGRWITVRIQLYVLRDPNLVHSLFLTKQILGVKLCYHSIGLLLFLHFESFLMIEIHQFHKYPKHGKNVCIFLRNSFLIFSPYIKENIYYFNWFSIKTKTFTSQFPITYIYVHGKQGPLSANSLKSAEILQSMNHLNVAKD